MRPNGGLMGGTLSVPPLDAIAQLIARDGLSVMLLWRESDRFQCEFRDRGTIQDLLVGRFRPAPRERRGRGIRLAHQLADLLQLRSGPLGTRIRLSFNGSA